MKRTQPDTPPSMPMVNCDGSKCGVCVDGIRKAARRSTGDSIENIKAPFECKLLILCWDECGGDEINALGRVL
jgi:hypothetical protein